MKKLEKVHENEKMFSCKKFKSKKQNGFSKLKEKIVMQKLGCIIKKSFFV